MTSSLSIAGRFGTRRIVDLHAAAGAELARMPWCHRVLLENVLRQPDPAVAAAGRQALLNWLETGRSEAEIPFAPLRILMHDTTCGPALSDIAATRDALAEAGGDPDRINPNVPVATSTDHSLAVDVRQSRRAGAQHGPRDGAQRRALLVYKMGVHGGPRLPGASARHRHHAHDQHGASGYGGHHPAARRDGVGRARYVGRHRQPHAHGDAMGVLGWGVGGIEAEGMMFDVPVSLRVPDVIGVRLLGALPDGVLATDLALTVTQRLRQRGLSGEFVEFFGPGIASLTVGQRAVAANMAPEYKASTGCFPINGAVIDYLRTTGREDHAIELVETFARANGLWFDPAAEPRYT